MQQLEFLGEPVPLLEGAVRADGTARVKIIAPGWGSSGYYPAAVLARDGPGIFARGLKLFWDHPTPAEEAERPERSLRDLAAELLSDARWEAEHPAGPGLYAEARIFAPYRQAVEELAPHIGLSIRAMGRARAGEAEGRGGMVIEELTSARSVDFVTAPGAGGRVLQLFEAARSTEQQSIETVEEEVGMDSETMETLAEANRALRQEVARLQEALLLREARDVARETLAAVEMAELTRQRLLDQVAVSPPVREGVLERELFATQVREAARVEMDYLARVAGAGAIQAMGTSPAAGQSDGQGRERLQGQFARLGLTDQSAKVAAGR